MIWVVGCKGMLGRELGARLSAAGFEWDGTDREIDIRSADALRDQADERPFDWLVNCAAYTAVEKAEEEPDLARSLNAEGAGNLAIVANEHGARFIHISTDYVFDGSGSRPYIEEDPVAPIGVYGSTKAEGERFVRLNCESSYIVRTAWLYGKHGPNFVRTMLRLMAERERVSVVTDQRGSPTYAIDLADVIIAIVRSGNKGYGTYHFTDEGETSWYDFAVAIRDEALATGLLSRDCRVDPITSDQYPTKVKRPAYSVLSKDKIKKVFGLTIPTWRTSLRAYLTTELAAKEN